MTTAFQAIFDNAATISINKRKKVAQTIARDGTVRSTSIGGQSWQFTVEMPNGVRYDAFRSIIEKIEALDLVTIGQVQINRTGQSYISGYMGKLANITAVTVQYASSTTLTITGGVSGLVAGDFIFKAGDFIQLGSGSVYTVAADVPFGQTTITVNRPIREISGTYTLKIGPNVVWNVICTSMPDWTITGYNQVNWSGPFSFAESLIA